MSSRKGRVFLLLTGLAFAGTGAAQTTDTAQTTPAMVPVPPVEGVPGPLFFETPTLAFIPKGTTRVTLGAAWKNGVYIPSSGLAGNLAQLGLVRIDMGFSNRIEVRVQGIVRQRLEIDEERSHQFPPSQVTGDTTHDAGDFSIITIARLMPDDPHRPTLGLRVEVKLPNTDEQRGIGTNTLDAIISVPVQQRFGKLFVVADFGLGILTEPSNAQSQNDVLVYGLAGAYAATPRLLLSAELAGRWADSGSSPGTESRTTVRGGCSYSFGPTAVGLLVSRGLDRNGERWGVTLALSYGFRVLRSIVPD